VIIHNDEIIIPDQGCNRVWRLKYSHDSGFTLLGSIDDFEEMDGPRHGVVHPNGVSSAPSKSLHSETTG
jgi:hypothetical protein